MCSCNLFFFVVVSCLLTSTTATTTTSPTRVFDVPLLAADDSKCFDFAVLFASSSLAPNSSIPSDGCADWGSGGFTAPFSVVDWWFRVASAPNGLMISISDFQFGAQAGIARFNASGCSQINCDFIECMSSTSFSGSFVILPSETALVIRLYSFPTSYGPPFYGGQICFAATTKVADFAISCEQAIQLPTPNITHPQVSFERVAALSSCPSFVYLRNPGPSLDCLPGTDLGVWFTFFAPETGSFILSVGPGGNDQYLEVGVRLYVAETCSESLVPTAQLSLTGKAFFANSVPGQRIFLKISALARKNPFELLVEWSNTLFYEACQFAMDAGALPAPIALPSVGAYPSSMVSLRQPPSVDQVCRIDATRDFYSNQRASYLPTWVSFEAPEPGSILGIELQSYSEGVVPFEVFGGTSCDNLRPLELPVAQLPELLSQYNVAKKIRVPHSQNITRIFVRFFGQGRTFAASVKRDSGILQLSMQSPICLDLAFPQGVLRSVYIDTSSVISVNYSFAAASIWHFNGFGMPIAYIGVIDPVSDILSQKGHYVNNGHSFDKPLTYVQGSTLLVYYYSDPSPEASFCLRQALVTDSPVPRVESRESQVPSVTATFLSLGTCLPILFQPQCASAPPSPFGKVAPQLEQWFEVPFGVEVQSRVDVWLATGEDSETPLLYDDGLALYNESLSLLRFPPSFVSFESRSPSKRYYLRIVRLNVGSVLICANETSLRNDLVWRASPRCSSALEVVETQFPHAFEVPAPPFLATPSLMTNSINYPNYPPYWDSSTLNSYRGWISFVIPPSGAFELVFSTKEYGLNNNNNIFTACPHCFDFTMILFEGGCDRLKLREIVNSFSNQRRSFDFLGNGKVSKVVALRKLSLTVGARFVVMIEARNAKVFHALHYKSINLANGSPIVSNSSQCSLSVPTAMITQRHRVDNASSTFVVKFTMDIPNVQPLIVPPLSVSALWEGDDGTRRPMETPSMLKKIQPAQSLLFASYGAVDGRISGWIAFHISAGHSYWGNESLIEIPWNSSIEIQDTPAHINPDRPLDLGSIAEPFVVPMIWQSSFFQYPLQFHFAFAFSNVSTYLFAIPGCAWCWYGVCESRCLVTMDEGTKHVSVPLLFNAQRYVGLPRKRYRVRAGSSISVIPIQCDLSYVIDLRQDAASASKWLCWPENAPYLFNITVLADAPITVSVSWDKVIESAELLAGTNVLTIGCPLYSQVFPAVVNVTVSRITLQRDVNVSDILLNQRVREVWVCTGVYHQRPALIHQYRIVGGTPSSNLLVNATPTDQCQFFLVDGSAQGKYLLSDPYVNGELPSGDLIVEARCTCFDTCRSPVISRIDFVISDPGQFAGSGPTVAISENRTFRQQEFHMVKGCGECDSNSNDSFCAFLWLRVNISSYGGLLLTSSNLYNDNNYDPFWWSLPECLPSCNLVQRAAATEIIFCDLPETCLMSHSLLLRLNCNAGTGARNELTVARYNLPANSSCETAESLVAPSGVWLRIDVFLSRTMAQAWMGGTWAVKWYRFVFPQDGTLAWRGWGRVTLCNTCDSSNLINGQSSLEGVAGRVVFLVVTGTPAVMVFFEVRFELPKSPAAAPMIILAVQSPVVCAQGTFTMPPTLFPMTSTTAPATDSSMIAQLTTTSLVETLTSAPSDTDSISAFVYAIIIVSLALSAFFSILVYMRWYRRHHSGTNSVEGRVSVPIDDDDDSPLEMEEERAVSLQVYTNIPTISIKHHESSLDEDVDRPLQVYSRNPDIITTNDEVDEYI